MSDNEDEIADLMSDFEDADDGEEMSDAEIAALRAAQAKLAADLDDELEGKPAGTEREVLVNLRKTQAIIEKILALAEAKKRPN